MDSGGDAKATQKKIYAKDEPSRYKAASDKKMRHLNLIVEFVNKINSAGAAAKPEFNVLSNGLEAVSLSSCKFAFDSPSCTKQTNGALLTAELSM